MPPKPPAQSPSTASPIAEPHSDREQLPDRVTPGLLARVFALGFLCATLLSGGVAFLTRRPAPPPIVLHPPPTLAPTATPRPTATPLPLTIFVSGGVASPGIYRLPWSARVGDALDAAGGLLEEVDPALVNQAERLFDGAQVHVPLPGQDAGAEPPAVGLSGEGLSATPATGGVSPLLDLNGASAEELMALPGIGPSKAAAIIANRPFASVDDLERVPGIGAKTLAELRPLLQVRP